MKLSLASLNGGLPSLRHVSGGRATVFLVIRTSARVCRLRINEPQKEAARSESVRGGIFSALRGSCETFGSPSLSSCTGRAGLWERSRTLRRSSRIINAYGLEVYVRLKYLGLSVSNDHLVSALEPGRDPLVGWRLSTPRYVPEDSVPAFFCTRVANYCDLSKEALSASDDAWSGRDSRCSDQGLDHFAVALIRGTPCTYMARQSSGGVLSWRWKYRAVTRVFLFKKFCMLACCSSKSPVYKRATA